MPRHPNYVPHGVIPAVLLPFNTDLSIDEESFRAHLRDVGATPDISAVTVKPRTSVQNPMVALMSFTSSIGRRIVSGMRGDRSRDRRD